MYYLYLDESGDHSLTIIDREYPIFVLAGVIIHRLEISDITNDLRNYKISLFNNAKIILHTADIYRNRKGFERLKDDASFRGRFYRETNNLIKKIKFTLIACIIDKEALLEKYGKFAYNPYDLSLTCILERYYYFLYEKKEVGLIAAESRNKALNSRLKLTYEKIYNNGIVYEKRKITSYQVRRKFRGFKFINKRKNIPGLQIADLCASPIGRTYIGKEIKEDYKIIESKFRRRDNEIKGFGLIIVPEELYN